MIKVFVLNGPNLHKLGSRQVDIYGSLNYEILENKLFSYAKANFIDLEVYQSNSEKFLIEKVYEALDNKAHIILNPGAFTHYSYALRDACAQIKDNGLKLIEVHISNIYSRESFRHKSVISPVSSGVIAGFGIYGYFMALDSFAPPKD